MSALTCDVCTEDLEDVELECNHHVHLECIARSGQNVCPVCRREVTFSPTMQDMYEHHREANLNELRQRESNESIALARQLQRGEDENEVEQQVAMVRINNVGFRIRFRDVSAGAVSADDLMLQLNLILHNIANRVRDFEVDERSWNLYKMMRDINELSATTGLPVQQLFSIVENNMF